MTYLGQNSCIDAEEKFLTPCSSSDNEAWAKVTRKCASRGLKLCGEEQYVKAYTDPTVVTQNSRQYAYTSTSCANEDQFRMMKDHSGDVYGCYTKRGCWSDRYYRCCSKGTAYLCYYLCKRLTEFYFLDFC